MVTALLTVLARARRVTTTSSVTGWLQFVIHILTDMPSTVTTDRRTYYVTLNVSQKPALLHKFNLCANGFVYTNVTTSYLQHDI